MAVLLEMINVLIPVRVIEQKYPGGWGAWREERPPHWHDANLARYGAMSGFDVELMLQDWHQVGLLRPGRRGGRTVFRDYCVLAGYTGSLRYPCDWLEVSDCGAFAWHSGHPVGSVIGPEGPIRLD
ncbi:hypothetical protein M0534_01385 [Methylonatrum kenyense]|uniref:hypothetical protein n=1 Tax=Methylonatrum kenyense TaxID=455253 RepID=UPI0020BDE502|nr:hypothetical protein [Methylonatrum kenyense]MCK8514984.1 hypothetical protein [Methylonatrum kenyense]